MTTQKHIYPQPYINIASYFNFCHNYIYIYYILKFFNFFLLFFLFTYFLFLFFKDSFYTFFSNSVPCSTHCSVPRPAHIPKVFKSSPLKGSVDATLPAVCCNTTIFNETAFTGNRQSHVRQLSAELSGRVGTTGYPSPPIIRSESQTIEDFADIAP